MIFLLKDGRYKVFKPSANENKVISKFKKQKSKIQAVLIECSTRLHSDMYTIIKTEHFKTFIEPFTLHYTLSLYTVDYPMDEEMTLSRSIYIDNVVDFYNAAALIYQMQRADDIGDEVSLGDKRVAMMALSIELEGEDPISWNGKEDIIEFVNRFDLICDTDDFLDAAVPKELMVEEGCYITRYNPYSQTNTLSYYYHDRKYYLWLYDGRWELKLLIDDMYKFMDGVPMYGMCLNRTGLLYMAILPVAFNLFEAQSLTVEMTRGMWVNQNDTWFAVPSNDYKSVLYEGYNLADILYMGLYLPQIWDVTRVLTGATPVNVSCEFLQAKRFQKAGAYPVPHSEDEIGLIIDLFAIFAKILSQDRRNISFDG